MKYQILILVFLFNCQTQRVKMEPKSNNSLEINQKTNSSLQDMIGKWYLKERRVVERNQNKYTLSQECLGKSYWEFKQKNNLIKFISISFAGADCTRMISSEKINPHLEDGNISYFEHDIMISKTIKFLNKDEFIIYQNDVVIDGKLVVIEDIYQRK